MPTSGTPATINTVIQFTGSTGAVWAGMTQPLPNGVVTVESDTGIMKRGDGVTLYANLPVFFNLSTLTTLMNNVVQKTAPAAQSSDLTAQLKVFALNSGGVVVQLAPADVFSWLVNTGVLKSVGGTVEVGP